MSIRSVLVTGANRGIGLEFVRQLLALETPPKHIIASCRNPDAAQVRNQFRQYIFGFWGPGDIDANKECTGWN